MSKRMLRDTIKGIMTMIELYADGVKYTFYPEPDEIPTMSRTNCKNCGAPAAFGKVNCEYCGSSLMTRQTKSDRVPMETHYQGRIVQTADSISILTECFPVKDVRAMIFE